MVFPTFFNLSLNLAIRSSWSEPQLAPGLVFADCIELLHFGCKEYNQSDFSTEHLVMSMCRDLSRVGRRCLLWQVRSLGRTQITFVLLHSILQGQIYLLLQVCLDFLLLHSSPLYCKGYLCGMLVLEGLIGHHRTIQLQLLQCYWSGHRLELPWYWMVYLGNRDHSVVFEIASKYFISDSFVVHDGYSISSKGFLPTVVDIMVIWVKFTQTSPF